MPGHGFTGPQPPLAASVLDVVFPEEKSQSAVPGEGRGGESGRKEPEPEPGPGPRPQPLRLPAEAAM